MDGRSAVAWELGFDPLGGDTRAVVQGIDDLADRSGGQEPDGPILFDQERLAIPAKAHKSEVAILRLEADDSGLGGPVGAGEFQGAIHFPPQACMTAQPDPPGSVAVLRGMVAGGD